jgi:cytochrome c oxidase subunit 1
VYALVAGGVDTGWTFYTPYSTMFSNSHVLAAAAGVFMVGFSSIATGVNFIATIHMLRAPGMTWFRLPLFVWAIYATSIIMVLATPVLAISLLLVIAERWLGLPIFDPARGGDPILFQHLFWFYSHPAVYIMVLPAMGVVSEIIPCFARRRIFGYDFMVYAMIAIAGIGFFVWGHHMFVSGQSAYANLIFLIPVLHYRGALGHQGIQLDGLAVPRADQLQLANALCARFRGIVHDRRPVRAVPGLDPGRCARHRHLLCRRALSLHHGRRLGIGILRRPPFLVAESNGKMYPESWAKFAAILMYFGFNMTFLPQFFAGYLGMPRRYHTYPPEYQIYNVMSSSGAAVLAVAYLLPLGYFAWSLFYGERAGNNPWGATGSGMDDDIAPAAAEF